MSQFNLFLIIIFFASCQKQKVYEIVVKEMTDKEYPDNPSLESRHPEAQQILFEKMILTEQSQQHFDLDLISNHKEGFKISLQNLPLLEMMPTALDCIKKDPYLTYIAVINQEWNRQQVQFGPTQFKVFNGGDFIISRVDLARNCLNSYLWEILVYAKNQRGKDDLYWQGWFEFPHALYQQMFEERNHLSFKTFQRGLEYWIDPDSKPIDLNVLRKAIDEKEISFENLNDEIYPMYGERENKYKNIIYPPSVHKISDLLSDSTVFATFSIPGYYNKKDPRKTELSKLAILKKVIKRNIINALGNPSIELELLFLSNKDHTTMTKFLIGGLDLKQIPHISINEVNSGWQTSMGIANHSFYETIDVQNMHPTKYNAFYSMLLDANGNWLDSHKIGIDGPLFHFDDFNTSKLHLWILSFERHAFVGHYILTL